MFIYKTIKNTKCHPKFREKQIPQNIYLEHSSHEIQHKIQWDSFDSSFNENYSILESETFTVKKLEFDKTKHFHNERVTSQY